MATQASPALLHRFLGIGLVTLAAVFLGVRAGGLFEVLPTGQVTSTLAYAMSGLAVLMAVVAVVVLRRRVPGRRHGQSEDQYWARPEVAAAVMPLWFLLEAAGILAAAGYLLTAAPVTIVTAGLLIILFWWSGPESFSRLA